MTKFNWFDFLAGSMDQEGMAEAQKRLDADPAERTRIESVRAFLAEVRREGLKQEIPLERLYRSIPHRNPNLRKYGTWALVGAATVAAMLIFPNLIRPKEPEVFMTSDFASASQWIKQGNGLKAPVLRFASARLLGSERKLDWGCYCLSVDGCVVHLAFTSAQEKPEGCDHRKVEGREFWAKPTLVTFRAAGLTWSAKGDNPEALWKVAREASAQL